jgi:hypothetical protein
MASMSAYSRSDRVSRGDGQEEEFNQLERYESSQVSDEKVAKFGRPDEYARMEKCLVYNLDSRMTILIIMYMQVMNLYIFLVIALISFH